MLKLRIRNWIDARFDRNIQASPHDQGYLEELPWLKQFIPLTKNVSPPDSKSVGIRFQTIAQLPGADYLHWGANVERYLADKKGHVLARVPRPGTSKSWYTPVMRALHGLGARETDVAYLVVTTYKCYADITVFKFPSFSNSKLTALADHIAALDRNKKRELADKLAVASVEKAAARDEAKQLQLV